MRISSLSLRLRLTLLMALILTIACISLMAASIYAARVVYVLPQPVPEFGIEAGRGGELLPVPIPPVPVPVPPVPVSTEQQIDFASIGFLCAMLIIAIGTGITYLVAGKALKPVTDLSTEIEKIDEHNLYRQVQVPPSKDEVARLSLSFNRMIHKLEKAFLAHKHFSANAAHELRTPLAAMMARIEVVQLGDPPTLEEYEEALDDTRKNAERLSTLIQDLLKMNADMNRAACGTFAAKELFQTILSELGGELLSKNIRIEARLEDVSLYGERNLLHRAFSNLLHNAIKYNKPNGSIRITAVHHSDTTQITIADTGIGIPEDHLDKIFEPFYCVDKSRSRELGGSGLGLSISKAVIAKHGGEIQVQSETGVATAFSIQLPNARSIP
ncbi:HAMP domain-containing protein [Paenibacillus hemerocallicola]|uniref:histidine kinase n=1 Tax=Paenibacillus hemerocallicola TaxID=1172614 RepID=A0A5C4T1H5_9BACL|nr:ATP-binding protein [Paenibacillus hemerocallicola]TNJ62600.1 HAMP domain-containing protein [Paenibacillus hemerocallicola]